MQAQKGNIIYIKNWIEKLDAFQEFKEMQVLIYKGKITHEIAIALANTAHNKYNKEQLINYVSAFDKQVNNFEKLPKKS